LKRLNCLSANAVISLAAGARFERLNDPLLSSDSSSSDPAEPLLDSSEQARESLDYALKQNSDEDDFIVRFSPAPMISKPDEEEQSSSEEAWDELAKAMENPRRSERLLRWLVASWSGLIVLSSVFVLVLLFVMLMVVLRRNSTARNCQAKQRFLHSVSSGAGRIQISDKIPYKRLDDVAADV